MAEISSPRRSSTPSAIPTKRPLGLEDEQHTPAVPSPLNPDSASSRARRPPAPREQREKKESLKKREAKGVDSGRGGTPESQSHGRKSKKTADTTSILSPIRYKLPPPTLNDFEPPKAPVFTPVLSRGNTQFYESSEHVYNRKGFRYTHCVADPTFLSSQYHRQSETEPYGPRVNFEDSSSHILFDQPGRSITTEKGFRMARANVGVREGKWYWECKILSGIKAPNQGTASGGSQEPGGHVRIGWARREASLDTPVGFDAYSYGLRDVAGQKIHMSRPKDFMSQGDELREGDVIGLEINLPSLALHRKVVEGSYNKAVDTADGLDEQHGIEVSDTIRDRVPIRYKAQLYFEQFEYHSTKELEELMNPSPVISNNAAASTSVPGPNHPLVPLRTLPFSCIKVYKNGRYVGTPFTDLLSFLPPASKPLTQPQAREGLDDGMLGYFPAVSVFRGGAAEVNFGPDFWFPPSGQTADGDVDMVGDNDTTASRSAKRPRAVGERYNEQIAEDIVYDLVDEVDFWAQDGGLSDAQKGLHSHATTTAGVVDPEASGLEAAAQNMGGGQAGEIKEVVQEEE